MKNSQMVGASLIGVGVLTGLVLHTDMQSETPNTTLWVAVLTTFGVVLTAVVTQLFTRHRELEARRSEHEREIEARLFEHKRAAYEDALRIYANMLVRNIGRTTPPRVTEQQIETLMRVKTKVLLWGDREMVRWWDSFGEVDEGVEPRKLLMDVDRLISMIRAELGVDNTGIEPGDLFSVYLAPDAKRLLKGGGKLRPRASARNGP